MFIVLEGLDGAGKSTQIRMLRRFFADRGVESEYVHFPRFDSPVYGELIARFLRGEFGGVGEVDPYLVALLFAGDRADAASRIREWLAQGKARPDVSLFLDVPFTFTERKLSELREGDDREYLQGGQDIHEASLALQQAVRSVYLEAAAKDPALRVVDCSDPAGAMDSPEGIFAKICAQLAPILEADAEVQGL